eukprot:gene5460-5461_t
MLLQPPEGIASQIIDPAVPAPSSPLLMDSARLGAAGVDRTPQQAVVPQPQAPACPEPCGAVPTSASRAGPAARPGTAGQASPTTPRHRPTVK